SGGRCSIITLRTLSVADVAAPLRDAFPCCGSERAAARGTRRPDEKPDAGRGWLRREGGQPAKRAASFARRPARCHAGPGEDHRRSEEHTSELQSRENLVCRLLLEKKKRRGR